MTEIQFLLCEAEAHVKTLRSTKVTRLIDLLFNQGDCVLHPFIGGPSL